MSDRDNSLLQTNRVKLVISWGTLRCFSRVSNLVFFPPYDPEIEFSLPRLLQERVILLSLFARRLAFVCTSLAFYSLSCVARFFYPPGERGITMVAPKRNRELKKKNTVIKFRLSFCLSQ